MNNQYSIRVCHHTKRQKVKAARLNDTVDYYDLTVVLSGQLDYIIDGQPVAVKHKDAILIPPGSHRIRLAGDSPVQYFSINFFTTEKLNLPLHIQNCTPDLKNLICMNDKYCQNHYDRFFEQKQILTLRLMLLTLQEFVEKKSRSPHVDKILQYISEHFTEKISLEDIAQSVFLTVPYCCNLVKKELGITIYEIILKERILLAKEYLLQGETPLRDIPYLCGFNDYSHFSKSFKKITGILPSKYKAR